jgi:tetratricopeptide (TPR) repeat protein
VTSQDQLGKTNDPNAPTAEAMLQHAVAAMRNGNPQEAERIARDTLSRHRDHPLALRLLGVALLEQRRHADAIAPLEGCVQARPDAGGETYLAVAYLAVGRSEESMTLLQQATERRPPFPPAFLELGKLLRQQHRYAEAEAILKRGVEAAPNVSDFPLTLGSVLLERGDMEGAKHAFAKALAIAPGLTAALQGLVYSLKDSGDFHAALEQARHVFARNPSDTSSHLLLATCLLELGKSEEATEQLRSLVGASPKLLGKALRAFTDVGHGRLWLKPSAAAEFLGVKRQG